MVRGLARRMRALVHVDESPSRTALALAVGVFIGCTPFWFAQTVLALLVATLFRLNKVATVTGVWLNLPWIAPLVYAAALKVGSLVIAAPEAPGETVATLFSAPGPVTWDQVRDAFRQLSGALFVGTTVIGLAGAGLTYVVALGVLHAQRRRRGAPGTGRKRAA